MKLIGDVIDIPSESVALTRQPIVSMISVDDLSARVEAMHDVSRRVMKEGVHYGKIPGVDKPCLFLPGAEILACAFQLAPKYSVIVTELPGGHRDYRVTCSLYAGGSVFVGEGVGSCSTMESKYRFRSGGLTCPDCGSGALLKDKRGDGHFCWAKKGGCGAKFPANDPRISSQSPGRTECDNPADFYNTAEKMACKRALVSAIKTPTGASEVFTVDLEDDPPEAPEPLPPKTPPPQKAEQTVINLELERFKQSVIAAGRKLRDVVAYSESRWHKKPSQLSDVDRGHLLSWVESDRPIEEWPDLEAEQIEAETRENFEASPLTMLND